MISVLGWTVPDNDADYYEPKEIRDANIALLSGVPVDTVGLVRKLKAAWLVKDPRMVVTLPQWTEAIATTASRNSARRFWCGSFVIPAKSLRAMSVAASRQATATEE